MFAGTTTDPPQPAAAAHIFRVADMPITEMRGHLATALEAEGFAILADIDLADFIERRIGGGQEPTYVLEVGHPKLTKQALGVAPEAALLMPCRVCVWKEGRGCAVATLPIGELSGTLGRPQLADAVDDTEERLKRVFSRLDVTAAATAPSAPVGGERHELSFDDDELETLREAARRQAAVLLAEVAGTESRALQRDLAIAIDRLDAIARKLGDLRRPLPRA
jgi:uncharacterized protein (DUF302 family)